MLNRQVVIAVAVVLVLIGCIAFYQRDSFNKVTVESTVSQPVDKTCSDNQKKLMEKLNQLSNSVENLNVKDANPTDKLEDLMSKIDDMKTEIKNEIQSIKDAQTDEETETKKEVKNTNDRSNLPDLPSLANKAHMRKRELDNLELDLVDITPLPKPDVSEMNDRWIVVTSIFGPTEDIRKLASIPGWKLVVVGDKKTPKDWKLDGVVFLSVEDQLKIGFETVTYLKYGVYQRKNMGYIYAIQHGAKYIYDTDDDNHPYKGKVTFDEMKEEKEYLMYNSDRIYYNGFAHFGQSTLWPRGYPLNKIDITPARNYKKCKNVRPLVQQGVVDGDPDLDAIQRLTRKDSTTKFVVYFDIDAPPVVLPPNSFVPYNSQNTFHHYDGFFALMLPQTVTFRVNDIWRSFIAQRLLWDVGGHLAYYPPNAYQDRTPHDFLQDFFEEDDLYRNALPITELLLKWKGTSTNMLERHFEVIKEIYRHDILGALDVRLARAWIRDLKRIGYVPPAMQKSTADCKPDNVTFYPKEQASLFLRIGQKTVNVVEEGKKLPLTKERFRDDKE